MVVIHKICSLLIFLSLLSVSALAQSIPKGPLYQPGEALTYEGEYSKLILRGIDVADFTFKVEQVQDTGNFLVKSEAKSKGGILKLFNYSFYQRIESLVDGRSFHILQTVKRDEQGDRIRDSEAIFDYESDRVTYIETDPNDAMRPPRQIAATIGGETHDIVSGMYLLRRLPLEVGKSFELTISDSGRVYQVPVHVTAREIKKSILGKTRCFRVEPDVFGEGRLIERDGKMIIWITDDARRLPVRSQIDTSLGKVVVKLKKIENASVPRPSTNQNRPVKTK